jgi:hypothetical protein
VSSDHLLRRGQAEGLPGSKRRPAADRFSRDYRGRDPPSRYVERISATALVVGPFGAIGPGLVGQCLDGCQWLTVICGRRRHGALGLGRDAYATRGLADTVAVAV